jgi:hypothetical protein
VSILQESHVMCRVPNDQSSKWVTAQAVGVGQWSMWSSSLCGGVCCDSRARDTGRDSLAAASPGSWSWSVNLAVSALFSHVQQSVATCIPVSETHRPYTMYMVRTTCTCMHSPQPPHQGKGQRGLWSELCTLLLLEGPGERSGRVVES